MSSHLRIYLVGAHSTGKTTLARWIRDTYSIPMISEVARGVLAEMEAQLDSLRSDIGLVDRYQSMVFERQLEAEQSQPGSFVSDRAFCNLAYAAQHATILPEVFADNRLANYMASVRSGLVFFLRPNRSLLVEDGTREEPVWEELLRIDGMVKLLLEMFDVPYIPVASVSMQESIRLVQQVVRLARQDHVESGVLTPQPRRKVSLTERRGGNGGHGAESSRGQGSEYEEQAVTS